MNFSKAIITIITTIAPIALAPIAIPFFGAIGAIPQGGSLTRIALPSNIAAAQTIDEQTNIRVYKLASPAVVSIDTGKMAGSGSIITPSGLVLTNAHVVQNAGSTVTVILSDGRRLTADVVAKGSAGKDLALLKIRDVADLPTITFASGESIQVGQMAFAIGNPFGQFQGTFTNGIVSRIDKQRGLIQTNAAINPGNSGGPLLNSQGELIGVNTAIFANTPGGNNIGIGFAISVEEITSFLVAAKENGANPSNNIEQPQPINEGRQQPESLPLDGSIINGVLDKTSKILPADNSFYNLYSFEGVAGQSLQIVMQSDEFEPYAAVLDSNGKKIAENSQEKQAVLTINIKKTGNYFVLVNSYEPGKIGSYLIQASTSK